MKRALVFGGGGAKGAYEFGVWKALRELHIEFDMVVGTSIGSLMGCLYVQNRFKEAQVLWENISPDQVFVDGVSLDFDYELMMSQKAKLLPLMKEALKDGGLNLTPMFDLLKRYVSESRIRKSAMDLFIVTVEVPSFTPYEVRAKDLLKGEIVDYLMASAACFPAFPLHTIKGKKFIDGGYYDNVPINTAIKNGASEIVAVSLKAPGITGKPMKSNCRIIMIEPYWSIGGFLHFDGELAKRNIQLGYLDTMRCYDRYQGFVYTFKKANNISIQKLTTKIESYITTLNKLKKHRIVPSLRMTLNKKDEELIIHDNDIYNSESMVIRLIEKLMELLQYDGVNIYQLKDIVKEIKEKCKLIEPIEIDLLFNEFKSNPKATFEKFDKIELICSLLELVKNDDADRFLLVAQIFKEECLLAILIHCLEK